ncbi:MAG: adenylate/guanylate cyclase domain-containing protein [Archangium sp.]|nr:adenylate/guanylate cyclase domain-containing protein [Archangium sp.]
MHQTLQSLVPESSRAAVEALLAAPPTALIDPEELKGDAESQVVALCVLAAASPELSPVLSAGLDWLSTRLLSISEANQGRYWHLRGVAAARERDFLRATVSMNRALSLSTPAYRPRVHDSFGRLLQSQGLVEEARVEYRTALSLREADEEGAALTWGNLARLELENGHWLAARDAFQKDHDIVLRKSPDALRLRAQLLTHLGECERGLGNHKGALSYFERARQIAEQAGDTFGHVIATVNQARELVHLRPAAAGPMLASVEAHIATVPAAQRLTLSALLEVTRAEHAAMEQRTLDAEAAFVRALDAVERSTLVSPIEHALIARSAARFQTEVFGGGRNVEYLQRALRLLDATSATALRADVENELRRASNDAWTLHVVSRFLGRSAVELAMREAGQAGFRGQRVELAVLFADLRGFTSAAEGLSPGELVDALNQILSRMAACVETMGGLVDKFVGDAVMALYGVEVAPAKAARDAVRSALLMQAELERLNRHAGKLGSLQMGVGVHFGPAVLGLIGSAQHRSYTALGDTVNFASRLEGMTRQLGATVLVSGAVVSHLKDGDFVLRALGRYAPKGAAVPIACFDVMGEARDAALTGPLQEELAASQGAVTAADAGEPGAARKLLNEALVLAKGTHRETGYRLRLTAIEGGDPVVRLSEK